MITGLFVTKLARTLKIFKIMQTAIAELLNFSFYFLRLKFRMLFSAPLSEMGTALHTILHM